MCSNEPNLKEYDKEIASSEEHYEFIFNNYEFDSLKLENMHNDFEKNLINFKFEDIKNIEEENLDKILEREIHRQTILLVNKKTKIPNFISYTSKVKSVVCGIKHNILVSESHQIYSWGEGTLGQTGLSTFHFVNSPTLISSLQSEKFSSIAACYNQSAALTSNSVVF